MHTYMTNILKTMQVKIHFKGLKVTFSVYSVWAVWQRFLYRQSGWGMGGIALLLFFLYRGFFFLKGHRYFWFLDRISGSCGIIDFPIFYFKKYNIPPVNERKFLRPITSYFANYKSHDDPIVMWPKNRVNSRSEAKV